MTWEVDVSDEFEQWYLSLTQNERISVAAGVDELEKRGPGAGRPLVDKVRDSRFKNMKELRVQHEGRPYRILFAFDPRRNAYLIIGGDKTGDDRWYEKMIPIADAIYAQHLREIGE